MRFIELEYDNKVLKKESEIVKILENLQFFWMIDSEIESARIKIENEVIIWESGKFYSGNWKFGIFKNGDFFGTWENGIFEGGNFNGHWISGIRSDQKNK